jgi:hypothetical protein
MLFLKYLTWVLTVGLAFAGAWLFEFAKADPVTGRKKLTPWGRRGIVVAALSSLFALATTVWGDVDTARKAAAAAAQSVKDRQMVEAEREAADLERQEAAEYRKKAESASGESLTLLRLLATDSTTRNEAERSRIRDAVSGLEAYKALEKLEPGLYERLARLGPFSEAAVKEYGDAYARRVRARVSTRPDCQGIATEFDIGDGFIGGHFWMTDSPTVRPALGFLIRPEAVSVDFRIVSDGPPPKTKYKLTFSDGSASQFLQCRAGGYGTCEDSTRDSDTRQAYEVVQKKLIARVDADNGLSFVVDPDAASRVQRTFSCLDLSPH